MSNRSHTMKLRLIGAVALGTVIVAAPVLAQQGPPRSAKSPVPAAEVAKPGAATVFWSLDKDGNLSLSDRPVVAATQGGSRSYSIAADQQSLARAQFERDYWRHQADGFSARQRDRERESEETRRLRLLDARDRDRSGFVPIYPRAIGWYPNMGAPLVGGFNVAPNYSSSPGAAVGAGPAAFIGSGFSAQGRR